MVYSLSESILGRQKKNYICVGVIRCYQNKKFLAMVILFFAMFVHVLYIYERVILKIKVIVRINVFMFVGLIKTLPVQGGNRLHIT